ncbi:MAG: hypothetical protein JWO03_2621 [Bacteroidetes bacterium]|nr:hypothetical protein [Bacteroidota bacterium]
MSHLNVKYFSGTLIAILILIAAVTGCKKSSTSASYQQVNLVADTAGYSGARIDANLKNAWGIAIGPTGIFWISANHTALTTVYDRTGTQILPAVSLNAGGAPTGVIYNSTGSFIGSKFIYAGEDGIISAWTSGTATAIVADRSSASAVYKGITIASDGGANFLYAADFKNGHVDVFDQSFTYVTTKPFADPSIPAGFAPFNIQNIGGKLYVTYAKQKGPDNEDDEKGAGNGYVNIFNPDGTLVKRFASQGTLNSPWGLTQVSSGFGQNSNDILVGNFGDGRINIYDANGSYQGQLMDGGTPITIDGLWALQFPQNGVPAGDQNQLFFTAGPGDEEHGLFGYIQKR